MRLALYGSASTAMAASVIVGAFRQRANFYAACVYLSKSNACMMILCNYGIFLSIMTSRFLIAVYFGTLRAVELERLHDRLWFTVTETLLALAMFRDEFDVGFVVMFVSLILVKCFHWLASDRVEWMDQTQTPPSKFFHLRMASALGSLWLVDMLFIIYTAESVLSDAPSVVLMFAMEYLILLATCWSIIAKYGLNVYALHLASQRRRRQLARPAIGSDAETSDSEAEDVAVGGGAGAGGSATGGWERKSTLVFYVDLLTDLSKLAIYVLFLSLALTMFSLSLPINVLRDVYFTLRSFLSRCANLGRWTRATRDMRTRYPDATRAEMEALEDKTCIICRDDMEHWETRRARRAAATAAAAGPAAQAAPDEERPAADRAATAPQAGRRRAPRTGPPRMSSVTPKKLPCGHIFHLHCLRSWLERQQTCPTCRRTVLDSTPVAPVASPADAPPPPAPGAAPGAAPPPLGPSPTGAPPAPGQGAAGPPPPQSPWHASAASMVGPNRPAFSIWRSPPLPPSSATQGMQPFNTSPGQDRRGTGDTGGPGNLYGHNPWGSREVQTPANNPLLRFELPAWDSDPVEEEEPAATRGADQAPSSLPASDVPPNLDDLNSTPKAPPRSQENKPSSVSFDELFPKASHAFGPSSDGLDGQGKVMIPMFDTRTGEIPSVFRTGFVGPHRRRPRTGGPGLGTGAEEEAEQWSQAEVEAATEVTRRQLEDQLRLLVEVRRRLDECAGKLSAAGVSMPDLDGREFAGASVDGDEGEMSEGEARKDKGKAPVEGLRAARQASVVGDVDEDF